MSQLFVTRSLSYTPVEIMYNACICGIDRDTLFLGPVSLSSNLRGKLNLFKQDLNEGPRPRGQFQVLQKRFKTFKKVSSHLIEFQDISHGFKSFTQFQVISHSFKSFHTVTSLLTKFQVI